jgi:hypothetical protein
MAAIAELGKKYAKKWYFGATIVAFRGNAPAKRPTFNADILGAAIARRIASDNMQYRLGKPDAVSRSACPFFRPAFLFTSRIAAQSRAFWATSNSMLARLLRQNRPTSRLSKRGRLYPIPAHLSTEFDQVPHKSATVLV